MRTIPRRRTFCGEHWERLPFVTQRALLAFRSDAERNTVAFHATVTRAVEWLDGRALHDGRAAAAGDT
jgi:hypothetical protein